MSVWSASASSPAPRGIRINAAGPVLVESMDELVPFFRGFVSAARVALGYSRSVEGTDSGQVYAVN